MKRSPLISPELLERIVDASEDGIVVAEQEGMKTSSSTSIKALSV